MKHSPAPWFYDEVGDTGGENPISVYEVTNGYDRICEYVREGDARLIAAAPDILSNLIKLVGLAEFDCLDDKSNVWRSALIDSRLAIEKATS